MFNNFHGNITVSIMMFLIIMIIIKILPMMTNTDKLGALQNYLKNLIEITTNQQETDRGFSGRNNNCIEYTNKGDRYENLSPKEYLIMIRPYFRDLINDHKPTM